MLMRPDCSEMDSPYQKMLALHHIIFAGIEQVFSPVDLDSDSLGIDSYCCSNTCQLCDLDQVTSG